MSIIAFFGPQAKLQLQPYKTGVAVEHRSPYCEGLARLDPRQREEEFVPFSAA